MTTGWRAAATAFLLFGATAPALAQQPAVLTDPHDTGAVRPGPGIESGFYDPATRRFTPWVPPASSATPLSPVSGTITVVPELSFDDGFEASNSIFCEITVGFGNHISSRFFTNHFADGNVNFSRGKPDRIVRIPYAYTPNSDKAAIMVDISCYGYDENGFYKIGTEYYGPYDLPNGDVMLQVSLSF